MTETSHGAPVREEDGAALRAAIEAVLADHEAACQRLREAEAGDQAGVVELMKAHPPPRTRRRAPASAPPRVRRAAAAAHPPPRTRRRTRVCASAWPPRGAAAAAHPRPAFYVLYVVTSNVYVHMCAV